MYLLNICTLKATTTPRSISSPTFRQCLKSPPNPSPQFPATLQCVFQIRALCIPISAGMMEAMTTKFSGEMLFQPILEEGVFRFDCSATARDASFPSLSFSDPKAREAAITVHCNVPEFIPTVEILNVQQIVKIQLPLGTSLYGTGEVSGQLERTGKRIFTWNSDAWGYNSGTTSLYQSHPWVLAVLPDGKALGVLADTARRCEIDLRESSTIKFVSGAAYPVITFGPFKSPTEVLISLSHAIGCILKLIYLIPIN